MTHTHDARPRPEHPVGRLGAGWDGDAALDLLIAHTGPGQTVLDLDADPILRAAAQVCGRRYRVADRFMTGHVRQQQAAAERRVDLATLAWPRPGHPHPASGRSALTTAAAQLTTGGHVAVLLEPAITRPSTITWTGALLSVARDAGLDYLQDIVCLHTTPDARSEARTSRGVRSAPPRSEHRVVLILRAQGGRHA